MIFKGEVGQHGAQGSAGLPGGRGIPGLPGMSGPPGPSGRDVSTKVEEEQRHESKHTEFLNFHFFESRDQGSELPGGVG